MKKNSIAFCFVIFISLFLNAYAVAQSGSSEPGWIRPKNAHSPAKWGIKGGIVFSLWPTPVATSSESARGGPRGLIRIGYNFQGTTYLINYIAIEPLVNGNIEYSEISPSRLDGELGKFIWAGSSKKPGKFFPSAITKGIITHPNIKNPEVEQLTLYLFIEKFLNGAHPYLKVSIRSDRPHEIKFQIFNFEDSALMQRCALTATMGNYSRLRLLYLKDRIIDSRELYKGFDATGFIEKQGYPWYELMRDKNGDFIAVATSNVPFAQLSSWPSSYPNNSHWRYRPPFKVTQYWRKDHVHFDSSLHVRVNGRAKYWSGGSNDPDDYIEIPGGVSFENFEMREKYYPGQTFYFGITRKSPKQMNIKLPDVH